MTGRVTFSSYASRALADHNRHANSRAGMAVVTASSRIQASFPAKMRRIGAYARAESPR
jgi:hypothetical protein